MKKYLKIKRTESILVRLTEEQQSQLLSYCNDNGLMPASFVYSLVVKFLRTVN